MGLSQQGKQNGGNNGSSDQGTRTSHHQKVKAGFFSADALEISGGLICLVIGSAFHIAGGWFHIAGFTFDFLVVWCGLTIITHHVETFKLFAVRYWLSLVVAFIIFASLAFYVVRKETASPLPIVAAESKQAKIEWQPPELPTGCKSISLSFGGSTMPSSIGRPIVPYVSENAIVSGFVTSNRFYVNADIIFDGKNIYSVHGLNFSGDMPYGCDRNFNANAFEIVGRDGLPILQVIYKNPENIAVNGVFPSRNGTIFSAFDDVYIQGQPDEVLAKIKNRKPIFRYPSWEFPSVLADQYEKSNVQKSGE